MPTVRRLGKRAINTKLNGSIACAAVACALASSPASAAGLLGASVTGRLLYPDVNTTFSNPTTTTLGADVEFLPGSFGALGSIDIGDNTITFFSNLVNGSYGNASFNGYRLDFAGINITSLTVAPGSTFTPLDYFIQDGAVLFNVSGQTPGGGFTVFNVTSAAVGNTVPEPATWALLILGFGAVGGAMRRRFTSRVSYAAA